MLSFCCPFCINLNEISGLDRARCSISELIYAPSVAGVFKNFFLAGVLKKRHLDINVVPSGAPTSSILFSSPPSIRYLTPVTASAVFVISSTCDTAAILESASPLNPREDTVIRSSAFLILLVVCFKKAFLTCGASIPEPLSVILIKLVPPSFISTVMAIAPASIEFSTSSFTTELGLSITSPAAI